MSDSTLLCPQCGSQYVLVTSEQMFFANTGEHYCHSVKIHDDNAKAKCNGCEWTGTRSQLQGENHE